MAKLKNQPAHKRAIDYGPAEEFPWQVDAEQSRSLYESSSGDQKINRNNFSESKNSEALFTKPMRWYWEIALWPMFILLVLEIGLRVMQTKYLYLWSEEIFGLATFGLRFVLFAYLAITAIKKFKADKKQLYTAVILAGIITGCVLAVFQLFWYFELWTIFNLIGQPLLFALIGLVVAWILSLFLLNNKK